LRDTCCSSNQQEQSKSKTESIEATSWSSKAEPSKTTSFCSSKADSSETTSCCSISQDVDSFSFKVEGMDCTSCAATIEKAVGKLSGVKESTVHFQTGKLKVKGSVDKQEIMTTVQKLGYKITEEDNRARPSNVYEIQGMDCGSCAATLKKHMSSLDEIQKVNVNFSTGKMTIISKLSEENIKREVKKAGYTAISVGKPGEMPKKWKGVNVPLASGLSLIIGALFYLGGTYIISDLFFIVSLLLAGYKPAKSAFYALKSRSLDMNVLMTGAALGAIILGKWSEGASVIWLFSLGTWLQSRSIDKTRQSISNLMDMTPNEASVKNGNEVKKVPVEKVKVGNIVVIKPGDKIPLDGIIHQGKSLVNEASITGESMPVEKAIGETVFAGTLNEDGLIEIEVTKDYQNTILANIIHVVEEAQEKKAATEVFVDRFSKVYTPVVFGLALLFMILPPLLGLGAWNSWFYKGLELLVIACPCALVISTPVAIVSAIGNAARHGVLIKGGTALEVAGKLNAFAFDKTGTLTEGKPKVSIVEALAGTEQDLIKIATALEGHSTHPIAKAILNYAEENSVSTPSIESFNVVSGKGVKGVINGETYFAGNESLFKDHSIDLLSDLIKKLEDLKKSGNSIVIIGSGKQVVGFIGVTDGVREISSVALKRLKETGIKETIMLTGDHEGTAKQIAELTAIDDYHANLLPEEKANIIKQYQSRGFRVGMVGDGINDAPALATADIGVAMGGAGTDTSIETADIVLMADNLSQLPFLIKLSRKTLGIIKQNVWFSLLIKVVALLFIFPNWMTLWIAILSDTGAALIVILNSMRLVSFKKKGQNRKEELVGSVNNAVV
jgi:Cd2+/Zn2+-exporting ATPase